MFSQKLHSEDELPDSVLAYVEASRNRMNAFEQLIIEDVEEKGEKSFLKQLKMCIKESLLELLHFFPFSVTHRLVKPRAV